MTSLRARILSFLNLIWKAALIRPESSVNLLSYKCVISTHAKYLTRASKYLMTQMM